MNKATHIRGVLFDKDGTLLDYDATWPPAYRAVAEDLADLAGNPDLAERIMRLGGFDDDGVLDTASVFSCGTVRQIVDFCSNLPELSAIEGIETRIDSIFTTFGERGALAVDNLEAILEGMVADGLRLGIATNDNIDSTKAWLAYNDFDRLFDFVAGADSGFGEKPDPGMMNGFCQATGLEPGEICMVGDTIVDAEFARAAGAGLCVIVRSGVAVNDDLAALADVVVSSVAELSDVIKA